MVKRTRKLPILLSAAVMLTGCSGGVSTIDVSSPAASSAALTTAEGLEKQTEETTPKATPESTSMNVVIIDPVEESTQEAYTEGTTEELTEAASEETETESTEAETTEISPVLLEGNGVISGATAVNIGGYVVAGNAIYCGYGYADSLAERYGNAVTAYANALEGVANVYSMLIPSNAVIMPDEYKQQINLGDQVRDINKMFERMGDNVIAVNIPSRLVEHKDEYLYFRTDHHWTQLGAYYAYQVFCEAKGMEAPYIGDYETVKFEGFYGSLYNTVGGAEVLGAEPEFIRSFIPKCETDMLITRADGVQTTGKVLNLDYGTSYMMYIGGDWPFIKITNHDKNDGSALMIIKDSFGNPMVPFLADDYNYVYVVDYRYFTADLITIIKENNINDVLITNAMALADSNMCSWLDTCRAGH